MPFQVSKLARSGAISSRIRAISDSFLLGTSQSDMPLTHPYASLSVTGLFLCRFRFVTAAVLRVTGVTTGYRWSIIQKFLDFNSKINNFLDFSVLHKFGGIALYNSVEVAEQIKRQSNKMNIQLKDVFLGCGLNKNMITGMRNGSMPKADNLGKIADYLNCSVDYLLGRTPEAGFQPSQFSEDEMELISLYRQLNQEGREKILDSADDLVVSGKYKKSGAAFLGAQAV